MAPASGYVSRGGLKLRHAIDTFGISPLGMVCADLGSSTGGFTDCLLQAGASRVYSIDTAYGQLAWTLRNDPRVVVIERTNALHAEPAPGGVDLVVADLGWTPQRLLVPAALRWLKPRGRIISLIKPHYELKSLGEEALPAGGVLDDARAQRVVGLVASQLRALGARVIGVTRSPIRGGAGKSPESVGRGNAEWLALISAEKTGPEENPSPPVERGPA
jgi:23S rRNA (cytidine1920-2'-O)/16S rRNA (cytidine1409-2'-O)-methyltransferase